MNAQLPEGLSVHECRAVRSKKDKIQSTKAAYFVALREGAFDESKLKTFLNSGSFPVSRIDHKGRLKEADLKDIVLNREVTDSGRLKMMVTREPGKTVSPYNILTGIFSLTEEEVKLAGIVKVPPERFDEFRN